MTFKIFLASAFKKLQYQLSFTDKLISIIVTANINSRFSMYLMGGIVKIETRNQQSLFANALIAIFTELFQNARIFFQYAIDLL